MGWIIILIVLYGLSTCYLSLLYLPLRKLFCFKFQCVISQFCTVDIFYYIGWWMMVDDVWWMMVNRDVAIFEIKSQSFSKNSRKILNIFPD